jgi:hypothetical protein
MQLKAVLKDKVVPLNEIQIGDYLLCDDGHYKPVRSKLLLATHGIFYRLSNGVEFHIYSRVKVKTKNGFKLPELWDEIPISKREIPLVVLQEESQKIMIICDILIDGNIVSSEGIVIKFGD